VIREKKRNVHAFAEGEWEHGPTLILGILVLYNPYLFDSFVVKETLQPIYRADSAYLYDKSVYI